MAKPALRDEAKEASWRGVVQQHAASGQSVRAFCRERRLSEASFYAWRRELKLREAEQRTRPTPAFVPVTVQSLTPVESAAPATGCTIELCGGRWLQLPASLSAQQVAELAIAFETADAAREPVR